MKRIRSAFTLIELLVVIAIIAILISLLVVSVQKVRESAARIQCQNNLHNIGLAIHNYADVNKRFPAGYVAPGFNGGWGWGAAILPFLDQTALHRSAGACTAPFGLPLDADNLGTPNNWTQSPLAVYRCPSDYGPDLNDQRSLFATSNYRAAAGPNPTGSLLYIPDMDMGGIMFQNSKVTFTQVTDGVSNTLLIGECVLDDNKGRWAALWAGMRGTDLGGTVHISDVMWFVDPGVAAINGAAPQAFSSNHPGGAFFLFADGTVRFVRSGVDVNAIMWMAGRNDGVVVNPDNAVQ